MALPAIGDDDVFDGGCHIVAKHLPKDPAVQPFLHGLAFYKHPRLRAVVEDHEVETLVQLTQFHSSFDGNIGRRVILHLQEVLNKILADPFFRCETYPLFAQFVPDLFFLFLRLADLEGMRGVIDLDHNQIYW